MSRRWPALVLLPGLLIGAAVIDRGDTGGGAAVVASSPGTDDGDDAIEIRSIEPATAMPVASAPTALGATWYCAGGTAYDSGVEARDPVAPEPPSEAPPVEGEAAEALTEPVAPLVADHSVIVANPTDRPVEALVTVFGEQGDPVSTDLAVDAFSQGRLRLSDLLQAPYAAALVEVPGGGVAVEHSVRGPFGYDAAPCASSASDQWFFAAGATTSDAQEVLTIFNPFPDAANIDITFSAEDGVRTPGAFEGMIVPGRSVVAAELGPVVTRRSQLSATVTARTGRVVVDRLQSYDGSGPGVEESGPVGLTVGLGAPRPAPVWYFPDGKKVEGATERFTIYNPTDREAAIDLTLTLADPANDGEVEPFELTVRPAAATVVDLTAEERVPDDVAYSAVARSLNGVPVVVERTDHRGGDDSSREGTAIALGSPLEATDWLFPAGAATERIDEWLTVLNPSADRTATVRISALADGQLLGISELQDLKIAPGTRRAVRLGEQIQRAELATMVTSDEPIVVERGLYLVEDTGISTHIGIPLISGARLPPDPTG
ncbi:hypothetical protein BH20ACT2_BH20ACT2_25650 [soil metagenome]